MAKLVAKNVSRCSRCGHELLCHMHTRALCWCAPGEPQAIEEMPGQLCEKWIPPGRN